MADAASDKAWTPRSNPSLSVTSFPANFFGAALFLTMGLWRSSRILSALVFRRWPVWWPCRLAGERSFHEWPGAVDRSFYRQLLSRDERRPGSGSLNPPGDRILGECARCKSLAAARYLLISGNLSDSRTILLSWSCSYEFSFRRIPFPIVRSKTITRLKPFCSRAEFYEIHSRPKLGPNFKCEVPKSGLRKRSRWIGTALQTLRENWARNECRGSVWSAVLQHRFRTVDTRCALN